MSKSRVRRNNMDNYEYDPPYEHNIPVDLSEEGQQIVAGAEQMLR